MPPVMMMIVIPMPMIAIGATAPSSGWHRTRRVTNAGVAKRQDHP